MTDRLAAYNGTLRLLGDTKLASLSENREPRRVLDDLWAEHTKMCLASGSWNFAIRSIRLDSDPDTTTSFGYTYVFQHPDDWCRTCAISADENFADPLIDYVDEAEIWKAWVDPIYVKYVSNDPDFGMDLTRWTPAFTLYVQAHLAAEMAPHHKNADFTAMDKLRKQRRSDALAQDALGQAPAFPPRGTWVRSRLGSSTRNERTRQSGP